MITHADDPEAFWELFKDQLNDPSALTLKEIQRANPTHGDTRETMLARLNRSNPKRLTSAECAAEAWHMMADWQMAMLEKEPTERLRSRCEVLHRFATLPHYDEETS